MCLNNCCDYLNLRLTLFREKKLYIMKYLYSHKVNAIITPRNVYTWTGLLSVPGFYCKPNPRKNSFFATILLHD